MDSRGSSPCVWGQVGKSRSEWEKLRIIPMRVGTSDFCRAHKLVDQDHPHACGDKTFSRFCQAHLIGSSPCVWGQGLQKRAITSLERIIPMRVGTSRVKITALRVHQDHPHACGDKTKEIKENSGFAKSTA